MWKCKGCGRKFPIAARISTEKIPTHQSFETKRVIVEKPCCPFCESLEFEEVKA